MKKDISIERLQNLPHDRLAFFAVIPQDTDIISLLKDQFGSALGELPWSPYPSVPRKTQYSVFVIKR
jgi:hypothetical protein